MIVGLIIGATLGAFFMSLVSITRQRDVKAVVDALEKYLLPPPLLDDDEFDALWGRVTDAFYRAREG